MENKITIYSLEHCGYCKRAKQLLLDNDISFKEVVVGDNDHCTRSELEERSGMKTFPQIFNGNSVIGGFKDLSKLAEDSDLKSILGINQ